MVNKKRLKNNAHRGMTRRMRSAKKSKKGLISILKKLSE